MQTYHIFPVLPAEIRNIIYSFCTDDSTTQLLGKTYMVAHTTTTISAVHHGIVSILSLAGQGCLEAEEYRLWLVAHGIEIRVGIHFHGHQHTFVEEHWHAKMRAHLTKLAKKEVWITQVARWDVRIVWNRKLYGVDRVKNGRIGEIVTSMSNTVFGTQDQVVCGKHGNLKVQFLMPFGAARSSKSTGTVMGLEHFLSANTLRAKKVCREVLLGALMEVKGVELVAPGLVTVPNWKKDEFLAIGASNTEWDSGLDGVLVIREIVDKDRSRREIAGASEPLSTLENMVIGELLKECNGVEEALVEEKLV